jgi:hypothetical protein
LENNQATIETNGSLIIKAYTSNEVVTFFYHKQTYNGTSNSKQQTYVLTDAGVTFFLAE